MKGVTVQLHQYTNMPYYKIRIDYCYNISRIGTETFFYFTKSRKYGCVRVLRASLRNSLGTRGLTTNYVGLHLAGQSEVKTFQINVCRASVLHTYLRLRALQLLTRGRKRSSASLSRTDQLADQLCNSSCPKAYHRNIQPKQ